MAEQDPDSMLSATDPHPAELPPFLPGSVQPAGSSGPHQQALHFPPPTPITHPASTSTYLLLLARATLHSPQALLRSISLAISLHPHAPLCAGLMPGHSGPFAAVLRALAHPTPPPSPPSGDYASALQLLTAAQLEGPEVLYDLLAVRVLLGLTDAWITDGCTALARGGGTSAPCASRSWLPSLPWPAQRLPWG